VDSTQYRYDLNDRHNYNTPNCRPHPQNAHLLHSFHCSVEVTFVPSIAKCSSSMSIDFHFKPKTSLSCSHYVLQPHVYCTHHILSLVKINLMPQTPSNLLFKSILFLPSPNDRSQSTLTHNAPQRHPPLALNNLFTVISAVSVTYSPSSKSNQFRRLLSNSCLIPFCYFNHQVFVLHEF
jgi:hypothetical protein